MLLLYISIIYTENEYSLLRTADSSYILYSLHFQVTWCGARSFWAFHTVLFTLELHWDLHMHYTYILTDYTDLAFFAPGTCLHFLFTVYYTCCILLFCWQNTFTVSELLLTIYTRITYEFAQELHFFSCLVSLFRHPFRRGFVYISCLQVTIHVTFHFMFDTILWQFLGYMNGLSYLHTWLGTRRWQVVDVRCEPGVSALEFEP